VTVTLEDQTESQYGFDTLRAAIGGSLLALPPGHAMSLLLASHHPGAHRILQEVLENEHESPAVRALAARHMELLPASSVQDILLSNINIEEETIRLEIIRILGRIGDRRALPAVQQIRRQCTGRLVEHAEFAKTLIAYRWAMKTSSYRFPTTADIVSLPAGCRLRARRLPVTRSEFDCCVVSLADEPFGIEYAERQAFRIEFEDTRWMVLFNRNLSGRSASDFLRTSNNILGVVAEWSFEEEEYHTLLLILSTPSPDKSAVTLHLHTPGGELRYIGTGAITSNGVTFNLETVSQTGLVLEVRGAFLNGEVKLEEIFYVSSLKNKRRPEPLGSS
jgi:hypothetical protein